MARLPLPRSVFRTVIRAYSKALGVNLSEAILPEGEFACFDEFFVRTLRPETRPVDRAEEALVAPCDGELLDAGGLSHGSGPRFGVKGRTYTTTELMGRSGWWDRIDRGGYAVIYLSPADYHRVHSPVGGTVRRAWHLDGTSYPVNRIGQILAPRSVVENERVVFDIKGPRGRVALVMVGALAVREIEVTLPGLGPDTTGLSSAAEVPVEKAVELGVFHLGSTVVVLWEGSSQLNVVAGRSLRLGQRLASW